MPESDGAPPVVELADVDGVMLEQLLELARAHAAPDEVTPPLGSTPGWNAERLSWFRGYHRAAAAGLDGPAGEKTWAVFAGGRIAGSVRLKRTGSGVLETGIWLGRGFRGRGIGTLALGLVADEARSAGADVLLAETTTANTAAQALLRSAGAALSGEYLRSEYLADDGGAIRARLPLH